MSGNISYCLALHEDDRPCGTDRTESDRKLSLAAPFVPDTPGPAAGAQGDNLFCHIHPCTFLELRFTDRYETYWECPDCEKEAYVKKIHGQFREMGSTTANSSISGRWFAEQGTGVLFLSTGG